MKIIKLNSDLSPIEQYPFEVVERKGVGHPDTLADGIAESISLAYSQYCLEHFGAVLHHNVDKTALFGGMAEMDFGSYEGKTLEQLKDDPEFCRWLANSHTQKPPEGESGEEMRLEGGGRGVVGLGL